VSNNVALHPIITKMESMCPTNKGHVTRKPRQ